MGKTAFVFPDVRGHRKTRTDIAKVSKCTLQSPNLTLTLILTLTLNLTLTLTLTLPLPLPPTLTLTLRPLLVSCRPGAGDIK